MITCTNNQIENREYPSWTAARSKLVGKICGFTSYSPLQLFKIYNVNRGTRRSLSATIFDTFRKEKDSTNHGNKPPSKRLREEDDNPATLVNEASTVTVIVDNLKEDQNFLITPTFAEQHKKQQAMKLNRLKDKNGQYQSHREFLSQYFESKLIPKGLKLELQPTMSNRDQEFLDTCYSNLQEFSLTLMKEIVVLWQNNKWKSSAH